MGLASLVMTLPAPFWLHFSGPSPRGSRIFGMFALGAFGPTLTGADDPEMLRGAAVTR